MGDTLCGFRQTQQGVKTMFIITPAAAKQIHESIESSAQDGDVLRLAVSIKEDRSFDYRMGLDQGAEDDIQMKIEGVQIVMAPEYVPLLDSTTLDYVELEDGHSQFIFMNPQDPSYVPPQDN